MSKGIDLDRFSSLEGIVSSAPKSWSGSRIPLAKRGVRLSWLIKMLQNLLEDINRPRLEASAQAERATSHNKAGMWGMHDQPDMPVPRIPNYAFLNVRSLVDNFVFPLTAALKAPLWAYVPEEHRGPPEYFVSHTWNSLLLGPPKQAIGTLDAIEHLGGFIWIDFVAYNQHTIESIPTDMEAVIGEIGKVIFAGTPVPTLGRIWCLWELLCANRTGTDFDIGIKPGYRNDKILAVNTLYRSFTGVEKAVATKQEDLKIISDEVLSQFGSIKAANEHLDEVLRERFSGSWYELRARDQHLGFRPWPWLYEQMEGGQKLANKPVKETDPYYGPGVRRSVMFGSDKTTFDHLIESGLNVSSEEVAEHQLRMSKRTDLALADAVRDTNFQLVKALLELGANPEKVIVHGTALAHAARSGNKKMCVLLLDHGVDIDGGKGLAPLACAAIKGHEEIVRLLLDRGADLEADAGGPGTALFQASSSGYLGIVELLLDQGADINAKTEKRATALMIATVNGHLEVVKQLISVGAELDCTDRSGDTALHHAAHKGLAAIVLKLLEAGADRTLVDKYGDTAFDLGKRAGLLDAAILKQLQI